MGARVRLAQTAPEVALFGRSGMYPADKMVGMLPILGCAPPHARGLKLVCSPFAPATAARTPTRWPRSSNLVHISLQFNKGIGDNGLELLLAGLLSSHDPLPLANVSSSYLCGCAVGEGGCMKLSEARTLPHGVRHGCVPPPAPRLGPLRARCGRVSEVRGVRRLRSASRAHRVRRGARPGINTRAFVHYRINLDKSVLISSSDSFDVT